MSPTQHPFPSTISPTRNNISRAFSLFLGYAIDRHDARTQVQEETARQEHSSLREQFETRHVEMKSKHENTLSKMQNEFLEKQTHHKNTIDTLFEQTEAAARNLEHVERAKEKLEKDTNSQIKTLESEFQNSKEKTQEERSRLMSRISEYETLSENLHKEKSQSSEESRRLKESLKEYVVFERVMFERVMFERVMFEREEREYHFSHPLSQRTHSCDQHNTLVPLPYPSLAIISIERFHFF